MSSGDGKELCDLLVVCGTEVIIFSEKAIEWPSGELSVAWARWFKRAVESSIKQARGAKRWIEEYPDRIFLDSKCLQRFPISLDKHSKIHLVIVARGAAKKCSQFFSEHSGSLRIDPMLRGNEKWSSKNHLFTVGDIDPSGPLVHVLDEITLEILLKELDTIQDFTRYLKIKSKSLRSGFFGSFIGEENLLAYYLPKPSE